MKEKIRRSTESITVGIMGGKVSSYRKKQEDTVTVRVYKDGYIGVAGAIGECDAGEVEKKAAKMLDNRIVYPCVAGEKLVRSESGPVLNVSDADIIRLTEKLLSRLEKETPNFIYSQSVKIYRLSTAYENDDCTKLSHRGAFIVVGLVIKDKGSANVFDASYFVSLTDYDEDKVVADIKNLYEAYYREAEIQEGEYVVAMNPGELIGGFVYQNFEGEKYAKGASLLSGKLGEKLFGEKVTMYSDYAKTPESEPFFDAEGTVIPGDRFYYIKDGVFCGVAASKRVSALYDLPLSGSGASGYDTVPSCSMRGSLIVAKDGRTFDEIAGGRPVIIPCMASGGDFTPTGDFSTPVQMALLYKDGKLVGRIRGDFSISANFFDMLGKDFEGSTVNVMTKARDEDAILVRMTVRK